MSGNASAAAESQGDGAGEDVSCRAEKRLPETLSHSSGRRRSGRLSRRTMAACIFGTFSSVKFGRTFLLFGSD